MHRSDLKHTLTAKSRAEKQEKKAQNEMRVVSYELWMVKDELQITREELKTARDELRVIKAGQLVDKEQQQADKEELQPVKDELCLKTMTLSRVSQEVSEAENIVGRLDDECCGLRDDLQRQLALVAQKEGMIVELRDEACTLWTSGWLSFRRKALRSSKVCTSIFPFSLRTRWGNLNLKGKMTLGCPRLPLALLFFLATPWSRLPVAPLSLVLPDWRVRTGSRMLV